MNEFAVLYFTSHAIYPSWGRIFESSMASVEIGLKQGIDEPNLDNFLRFAFHEVH